MIASHDQYFGEIIRTVEAIVPQTLVAVISWEGLVLRSNVSDEHVESQFGALASVFLDQGKRMFTIPFDGKKPQPDTVQTMVTVGTKHVIIMTQLLPGILLAVSSDDKSKINTFRTCTLEEVDKLHAMIAKKEIIF